MNKNILFVGNYPPPYGGVPHHIERLTKYLVLNGWSCHVLSGGTSGIHNSGELTIYKPTYFRKFLGLVRQTFKCSFKSWLAEGMLNREEPKLWRRYKMYVDVGANIIRDHDINLIVSYNLLTYAPIGAFLANKFNLPHIINIFGEIYKYKSMVNNNFFFSNIIKNASRILSCSDHCGRSLKRIQVKKSIETVIYGVDVDHFSPGEEDSSLRAKLQLSKNSPIILFVGRLGKEMGLDSFFMASQLTAKHFPGVCFVMVGQDGDLTVQLEKKCQTEIRTFIMIRNSPYSDLPKYYRLASMVVIPTRGDRTCSSLVAMEAMATQRPVIGYSIGGIPEIIEHEKTGLLVESEDTQALANAMERLLRDNVLCEKLAKAGYQQAQIRFDEKLVNLAMERHFLDVITAT